jgi:hypothetical protein
MPEQYRVTSHTCLPNSTNTTSIHMDVVPVNNPPTPVSRIRAYKPSQQSFEREVTPRRADLYLSNNLFGYLKTHVDTQGSTVLISYNAPAISGDDLISGISIVANY